MFEYNSSHVTCIHQTQIAKLRHEIAQRDYADRKAARILMENAQRQRGDRSRIVKALRSALGHCLRPVTRAVPHRDASRPA